MAPDLSADGARFEDAACAAARVGGELLRRRFRETEGLLVELKGLHDYVTDVDRQAEAAVVGYLRGRFPEHAFLAEEGHDDSPGEGCRWIVDPLDGTTNFIHGVGTFAVSVALEDGRGLLAAAVYDPIRDEMFHAHRAGGARLDGRPIRCSRPVSFDEALIATGFPFRELARLDSYLKVFERFVRTSAGLRRAGSAALDLAYTACGRYDGFWEIGLSPWDVAAGALLVLEAGGTVTDLEGGDGYLETGDIIAGGPDTYRAMLPLMGSLTARSRPRSV